MNNVTERLESKINKMTAQSHPNKQMKTNDSKYIYFVFHFKRFVSLKTENI